MEVQPRQPSETRWRFRGFGGQARRDLYDAQPGARHDGAARDNGDMGGRQADLLDIDPADELGHTRSGQGIGHSKGKRPAYITIYWRRHLVGRERLSPTSSWQRLERAQHAGQSSWRFSGR